MRVRIGGRIAIGTDITFVKELEIQSAEGELAVISVLECYSCKWNFVGNCMRYDTARKRKTKGKIDKIYYLWYNTISIILHLVIWIGDWKFALSKIRLVIVMSFTEKQKRFCDYYIETGNATEAARLAGYKGSNHDRIASENLRKPEIKRYIGNKMAKKDAERIASQDEVLEYLTSVMRGKVEDFYRDEEGNKKLAGIRANDRNKAAEMLAKRYRLFDSPEVNNLLELLKNMQTMSELINKPVENRTFDDIKKDEDD